MSMMLSLALALATLGASPSERCEPVALPVIRDSAETLLVATATRDTVRAPGGGPNGALRWVPAEHRRQAWGQLAHAGHLRGADSLRLERAFGQRRDRRVLIVPWSHGPDCSPWWWSESSRWAPVGMAAAYRLRLREESDWVDGIPVLDALIAHIQPYPFGILAPQPPDSPALTPAEYVNLLMILPTAREAEERSVSALARLDAWERAHSLLAPRYPAVHLLRNTRAWLRR